MSDAAQKYTLETITNVRTWVPGKLFSFTCTRSPGFRFTAGQFARLGIENTLNLSGEPDIIWRAYSMVSGPYDEQLEFFSIVVPAGAFTGHLSQMQVGASLLIDKTSFGFLTTSRFKSGGDLWLLSSGTGLAPFLSILHDPNTWEQFEKVVLVYSVRTEKELAYQNVIHGFVENSALGEIVQNLGKRFLYVPVVTRENISGCLSERIPLLLNSGQLSTHTGLPVNLERSRFMICGNPEMVRDTREALVKQGYSPARQSSPGEIAVENYW